MTMLVNLLLILAAVQCVLGGRLQNLHRQPLRTDIPLNIAHRGSSGEIPEETTFAYKKAIEEGAAFIETDVAVTKDGALICFHDVILDAITNVADFPEFASRKTTYKVEGVNVTGFFTTDFTLSEIKRLRVKQRYGNRVQSYNGQFGVITFEEFIAIALDADRTVGIYPEIKSPVFYNEKVKWSYGRRFEDVFVSTLRKYGYYGAYNSQSWLKQPVFIQSFAPSSLVYLANRTELPKVLLIETENKVTQDTHQSFEETTSDANLDYMKDIVVGIGPCKESIVPVNSNNQLLPPTDLVDKAHARGLQVHPWTFDNQELHENFRQDPYEEYDYFLNKIGIDGVFTNFPATVESYLVHWGVKK